MVAAATVGAVASLGGAYIASSGAKSAAKTQAQAAAEAGNQEWAMYQQNREDMMPWLEAGKGALTQLSDRLGTSGNTSAAGYGSLLKSFGAEDFQADPGYQFRLSEGQKALERSQAAKGGLLSGAATKAAQSYGQGLASQEYQAAYDRYNNNQSNIYNRLAGLSGTGQTAAGTLGAQGANTASNITNLITGAGNAAAAGQVGSANAWNTGLTGVTNTLNSYGTNQILQKLLTKA